MRARTASALGFTLGAALLILAISACLALSAELLRLAATG